MSSRLTIRLFVAILLIVFAIGCATPPAAAPAADSQSATSEEAAPAAPSSITVVQGPEQVVWVHNERPHREEMHAGQRLSVDALH